MMMMMMIIIIILFIVIIIIIIIVIIIVIIIGSRSIVLRFLIVQCLRLASRGSSFRTYFTFTVVGVVPCGGRKTSHRTSS